MIRELDTGRRPARDRRKRNLDVRFADRRNPGDRRRGIERRNALIQDHYLRSVLNAFPSPVLIVDHDLHILDANNQAVELIDEDHDLYLRRLDGDLMQCLHARQSEDGCGTTEHCPDCALRQTVHAVAAGEKTFRRMAQMKLETHGKVRRSWFLVSGSEFEYLDQKNVILTIEDVSEIVELRRLIPICANCKKMRDDNDYWQEVEKYFDKHTSVQFSHGLCPECLESLYGDQGWYHKHSEK